MIAEPLQPLSSEVLALKEAEGAELAHDLIQNLDAPHDNGVEDAWDREISRRIGEIDTSQASLVERSEFRRRIREKLCMDNVQATKYVAQDFEERCQISSD